MAKKRGLGKSLDALLAYTDNAPIKDDTESKNAHETLTDLSVNLLQRGKYQPRRDIDNDSLEELANSIRQQGVIQPLIVRPVGNKYEIIAGERRWQASKLIGLETVPVIIRDIPDDAAIAIALIENIQRENLNPIEEAIALHRLGEEFGLTHQQVAEAVGKSRTSVTNLLRLLSLPEEVKSMLERGLIEMGHARTLVTLSPVSQLETAQLIISKGLSVRETEQVVRRMQQPTNTTDKTSKRPADPDIIKLQESLTKQLRMRVAIQCNAKGKGKLVVHYRNLNELDHLLHHFEEDANA